MPRPKTPRRPSALTKNTQKALLSLALGKLACSPTPSAPPPSNEQPGPTLSASSTAPSTAPSASAPPEIQVTPKLLPYTVLNHAPARHVLYTWTTREQIDEILKNKGTENTNKLLTRSESPSLGSSYYDQRIDERAKKGDALATLLRTTAFVKARFAWPAPWATYLGFPGEIYGDELIQIRLKPEAWTIVFHTSKPELAVVDLNNKSIPIEEALAHPERIAAVFFVHDDPVTGYAASSAGLMERSAYREYILVNESMIASFSVHTDEIRQEIQRSAEALEEYIQHLAARPDSTFHTESWSAQVAKELWSLKSLPNHPIKIFESALAFPNNLYLPSGQSVSELPKRLRAIQVKGAPFTHTPTLAFPPKSALKPAPPPRKVGRPMSSGTY